MANEIIVQVPGQDQVRVPFQPGMTVQDAISASGSTKVNYSVLLNGTRADKSVQLQPGSHVMLAPNFDAGL